MAPKMQSPFGLFVAKMKRLDRSLSKRGMAEVVSHCNRFYVALDPTVKKRFESLSAYVRQKGLKDWEINPLLDRIRIESIDNNNTDDENWDNGSSAGTPASVSASQLVTGFQFNRIDDNLNQSSNEKQIAEDFANVMQCLEAMPDLLKKTIITVCFNVLVQTVDGTYYPNEIGLTAFTVEDGVKEFHTNLIRNHIPDGYYASAKEHSNASHKLPINPMDEEFVSDIPSLFDQIYQLMSKSELIDSRRHKKIVFCKTLDRNGLKDEPQVIGCMKWLDQQMVKPNGERRTYRSLSEEFVVYDLAELLFLMTRKHCQSVRAMPLCVDDLSKFKYVYNCEDMNCRFHSEIDNEFCAAAVSKRIAYLFLDSMFTSVLKDVDIKPTARHRPVEREIIIHSSMLEIGNPSLGFRSRRQFRFNPFDSPPPTQAEATPTDPNTRKPCSSGLGRGRLTKLIRDSN